MKFTSVVRKTFSILFHLFAMSVIVLTFVPFWSWYLRYSPLWGVDFYYTASLVRILMRTIPFPALGWNSAWLSCSPLLSTYAILHCYFILALSTILDLFSAIKMWMLLSATLFFLGSYFAFYLLSRSRVLSVILAIGAVYSIGFYGALLWGGSLPSFATQAFLPWTIVFVLMHLRTRRRRYLYFSGVIAGLSIWGHPQVFIAYITPAVAAMYLLTFMKGRKFRTRLISFLTFLVVSILVGLPLVYRNVGALTYLVVPGSYEVGASSVTHEPRIEGGVFAFLQKQPLRGITDTQPLLYIIVVLLSLVYVSALFIRRGRQGFGRVFPYLALFVWYFFYLWLFGRGISMFHGGWYRLFWTAPLWIGLLSSAIWGRLIGLFPRPLLIVCKATVLLVAIAFIARPFGGNIRTFTRPDVLAGIIYPETFGEGYYHEDPHEILAPGTMSLLSRRSQTSSAFPDLPSMKTGPKDLEYLRGRLVPKWIDAQSQDYRLYDADQTVNIWWSALFPMPLARGYLDPPSTEQKGYTFWMDASLNRDLEGNEHQLVGTFGYPKEIAINNTLFLIDWYAAKYFEAGHAGPTVFSPLPEFLMAPEYMEKEEILNLNDEKFSTGYQELRYFALADKWVSPILSGVNTPTVGIVSSRQGYETFMRAFADVNWGVGRIIPIYLGRRLDRVSAHQLQALDSLFLYDYEYSDQERAFKTITAYVSGGGKIFIDSGVETKESVSHAAGMPQLFPFERMERTPLGRSWDFSEAAQEFLTEVTFSSFDDPLFDDQEWNFSYPTTDADIREGAEVLLKNHSAPIVIERRLGEGLILWSGMNLPYHAIRKHNPEEIRFFETLLGRVLPPKSDEQTIIPGTILDSRPQQREIRVSGVKGVLLKEQGYNGWVASVTSNGKKRKLPIYQTGPAYPGFMYVRIPDDLQAGEVVVAYHFRGSLINWVTTIGTLVIVIFFSERALLGGYLVGRHALRFRHATHAILRKWWEREDE